MIRRIIAVLLENEAGALSRVVSLFAQRNYNIETLTVAPTEDKTLSRLTITTSGDDSKIEQITKQLNKLIEVVEVMDLSNGDHIESELMLIKIRPEDDTRADIKAALDIYRGKIIDDTKNLYTVQLIGTSEHLSGFIRAVGVTSILEVVRSGVSGISLGHKILSLK
jgi:acetolactate synthase-1/3 small subunit